MVSLEPSGIVTLLTDFGLVDTFVGQMKGVLLSIDPALRIVDLTHGVAPQDITEGAFQLSTAFDVFPSGSVHVVVVDPGVGTERRAICVLSAGQAFIGPDNGVLEPVLENVDAVYAITNPRVLRRTVTATFHGRDVFAPAAGRVAAGMDPQELGPNIDPATLVRLPATTEAIPSGIRARIVSIDRFGNCITQIASATINELGRYLQVECGDLRVAGLKATFADVGTGQTLALIGSSGTLELAVRDGNAACTYGLKRGDWVSVRSQRAVDDSGR